LWQGAAENERKRCQKKIFFIKRQKKFAQKENLPYLCTSNLKD